MQDLRAGGLLEGWLSTSPRHHSALLLLIFFLCFVNYMSPVSTKRGVVRGTSGTASPGQNKTSGQLHSRPPQAVADRRHTFEFGSEDMQPWFRFPRFGSAPVHDTASRVEGLPLKRFAICEATRWYAASFSLVLLWTLSSFRSEQSGKFMATRGRTRPTTPPNRPVAPAGSFISFDPESNGSSRGWVPT